MAWVGNSSLAPDLTAIAVAYRVLLVSQLAVIEEAKSIVEVRALQPPRFGSRLLGQNYGGWCMGLMTARKPVLLLALMRFGRCRGWR